MSQENTIEVVTRKAQNVSSKKLTIFFATTWPWMILNSEVEPGSKDMGGEPWEIAEL